MILFFDDDRIGLSVRKALLETTGAVVLAVDDGEDGLKLFADGGVGVVVLNFTVPRIDGGELVVRFFSPLRLLARDLAAPEKCLRVGTAVVNRACTYNSTAIDGSSPIASAESI